MVYDYGGNKMTDESIFESTKGPQEKQIGGSHYKSFLIQPYEFISKNDLSFFQGKCYKIRVSLFEQEWHRRSK